MTAGSSLPIWALDRVLIRVLDVEELDLSFSWARAFRGKSDPFFR